MDSIERAPVAPDDACNLLVISDLHLTLCMDDEDRATDREIAAFLDHYAAQRAHGRGWRLVLAGDVFEFVYPDMEAFLKRRPGPDAPEPSPRGFLEHWPMRAQAWRLRMTMREFPEAFLAIGRFVAAGHRVVIVKGNHDVELQWARLQQGFFDELQALLEQAGAPQERAALEASIEFHTWFWYEPGRFYVEHGNQYDEFNAMPNFLDPALVTDPDRAFSPMGSRLTHYLTNAFPDYKPRPDSGAFMRYLERTGQKWSRKYIGRSLTVLHHSLAGSGLFSEEGWQAGSGRQDEGLAEIHRRFGLDLATLERLQALQTAPVTAKRSWVVNRFGLDRGAVVFFGLLMIALGLIFGLFPLNEPALITLGCLGPVALVVGVLLRLKFKRGRRRHKWFALLVVVGACVTAGVAAPSSTLWGTVLVSYASFVTIYAFLVLPLTEMSDLGRHLVVSANRVGKLLDVPLVIFGHHHQPLERELQQGRIYMNSGAWANSGIQRDHAHVVVVRDEDGRDHASLRRGPDFYGGET